jgi:hypothetical protein
VQQYLRGESPSLNHLTAPNFYDLSHDVSTWGSWWPPGQALAVYPLAACGIPLGEAVRWIVMVCLLIGSAGWVMWFALFSLPESFQIALALFIPWMRYPSNAFFAFTAEIFLFATAPWVLRETCRLTDRWEKRSGGSVGTIASAALLGGGLGLCYVLKYSTIFVSLGALLYLGLAAYRPSRDRKAWTRTGFWMTLLFFLIPVVGLNVINRAAGQVMNNVSLTACLHVKAKYFLWIISLSSLALADGCSLLQFIFLNPSHGIFRHELPMVLLGVPGGLLVLGLLLAGRPFTGPARLGVLAFLTGLGMMLGILNLSRVGDFNARYIITTALGVLPVVLDAGCSLWRRKPGVFWRLSLAAAGIAYLAVPFSYGVVSVWAKVLRTPAHYRVGSSHFYSSLLALEDVPSVTARLSEGFNPVTDIWYASDPTSALDLPGRVMIRNPDYTDLPELKEERFQSADPLRVRALLLPKFEAEGKGPAIRNSFRQAGSWTRTVIPGSQYVLWTTTLRGTPKGKVSAR